MSILHRDYWKLGEKVIRVHVSFNKQTTNWASGRPMKVGYRVSLQPLKNKVSESGYIIEEYDPMQGVADTLLEVDRQSSKRLQTAIDILNTKKEEYLNYLSQQNIEL